MCGTIDETEGGAGHVETESETVEVASGCLVEDSIFVLEAYVTCTVAPGDAILTVVGDKLRVMDNDNEFDWNSSESPDRVGSVISGPDAWRLLLLRKSTREKIDGLQYKHGLFK